jgi:hypothetical protein
VAVSLVVTLGGPPNRPGHEPAIHAQRAVAPNRILITRDGHVEACNGAPDYDGIASVWTETRADGTPVSRYLSISDIAPKFP